MIIMIIVYQVGFMSAVTTTICDSFPDVEKKLIAKVFILMSEQLFKYCLNANLNCLNAHVYGKL